MPRKAQKPVKTTTRNKKNQKLWGSRFKKKTHPAVERLTESLSFDRRLYRHDIQGSIAHAATLARTRIITESEKRKIIAGLRSVERDIAEQAAERVVREGLDAEDNRILVLASDDWHGGVIGIVASRMVERFARPAVLVALVWSSKIMTASFFPLASSRSLGVPICLSNAALLSSGLSAGRLKPAMGYCVICPLSGTGSSSSLLPSQASCGILSTLGIIDSSHEEFICPGSCLNIISRRLSMPSNICA